jgi:hypothetical protein
VAERAGHNRVFSFVERFNANIAGHNLFGHGFVNEIQLIMILIINLLMNVSLKCSQET